MRKATFLIIAGLVSAICFVGVLLGMINIWLFCTFPNITLDVVIIYCMQPLVGVDKRYIYYVFLTILISALCTIYFARYFLKVRRYRYGRIIQILMGFGVITILVVSLTSFEYRFSILETLFPGEPYSDYVEQNYAMPAVDEFVFPSSKNNLIVLFLESMEWTFADTTVFNPILLPNLDSMQSDEIGFHGHCQTVGTEYSALGFSSLLYGIPMRPDLSVRNKIDLFLGNTEYDDLVSQDTNKDLRDVSIVGLLNQNGYDIVYFRAADVRFNGYDEKLEMSTNSYIVRDYEYFLQNHPAVIEKQNNWGLYDGFLYEQAKEYLKGSTEPFFMLIETVNTHAPGHYEHEFPRRYGDMRDAYLQADTLAADFIEWVRQQPFGPATTILVMGDHLLGEKTDISVNLPPFEERSILALFVNSFQDEPLYRRRLFATWDLAPTLLESIGIQFPGSRFGLGTSLFSGQPTLLEKVGVKEHNKRIRKRSKLTERIYGW